MCNSGDMRHGRIGKSDHKKPLFSEKLVLVAEASIEKVASTTVCAISHTVQDVTDLIFACAKLGYGVESRTVSHVFKGASPVNSA